MNDKRRFRYPLFVDIVLALVVLIAVAGFALGMFKAYIAQHAKQCMAKNDFKSAIQTLRSDPAPGLFTIGDTSEKELLSQSLYLDAMKSITKNDLKAGLDELAEIPLGTRYSDLAKEIIHDNSLPASAKLPINH